MRAEVTLSNLLNNPSLSRFFFRAQSWETFEELLSRSACDEKEIEEQAELRSVTLDEFEEDCHNMSVEELAKEYGITLNEEED